MKVDQRHPICNQMTQTQKNARGKGQGTRANMPQDRKERLLKKRREDYHRRKAQALLTNEDSQPTIPLLAEGY